MALNKSSKPTKPKIKHQTLTSPKNNKTKKYALLSVYDKTGIVDFAKVIIKAGYEIISTGGTAKTLTEGKIRVIPIQDITGNPESFEGRMKTISFQIEGGILFDRKKSNHVKEAKNLNVPQIDLVVANLYPFEKTISDPKIKMDDAIEQIDVGGPTMVRSAGKNHKNVLVVVDPNDYERLGASLKNGKIDPKLRRELATKAFRHLSFYDSQIGNYLDEESLFSNETTFPGRKTVELKYGENPHQKAALYIEPNSNSPIGRLTKVGGGRESSATNITDINAGIESVRMFPLTPAAVIIKHNTPSGIALGESVSEALKRAIESDPVSAFGGIVVTNRPLDIKSVSVLEKFKGEHGQMDVISAPQISDKVLERLIALRKRAGIYTFGEIPKKRSQKFQIKPVDGGFILQDWDDEPTDTSTWKVVTKKKPTKKQITLMKFGWDAIRRMRSNTIVIVDKEIPMTRGIGSGQTSRVEATKLALSFAKEHSKGGLLISDSFFPFNDSVKLAAEAGIGAILQQGGSTNDQDSIDAANEAEIPMVFTGKRAFWH